MDDEQQGLTDGAQNDSTTASAPGAPEQLETEGTARRAPAASAASTAEQSEILKRIEAAEERGRAAERRAAQAEAYARKSDEYARKIDEYARTVQASKDRENAQVRKETKERLASERAATVALLKSTGVDPAQLDQFTAQRSQDDETDELRYKAAAYDNLAVQEQIKQQRDQYVRSRAELFGVDPSDPRLDVSSPDAFDRSLAAVVKAGATAAQGKGQKAKGKNATDDGGPLRETEDGRRSTEEEPSGAEGEGEEEVAGANANDRNTRVARQDLDVLGGGGAAANDSEREFQKQLKELRGTGQVAEAMRLIREHENKSKGKS